MRISKNDQSRHYRLPVNGAGSDIKADALLKKDPSTPGTYGGVLVKGSGTSAIPDALAILEELHDYSVDGDSLVAGTNWVTRAVELLVPSRIITIEFDLTSLCTCTQAVSTTTMTVTNLEDNIDGAFLYVVSGVGLGQSNYLTASAAGACTLKAAFGTDLDTTSKFIKILPRFHKLLGLNSDGTKLSSQVAAGAVAGAIIDIRIQRAGISESLNPTKHDALTGLSSIKDLKFEADIILHDTLVYPVD